MTCQQDLDKLFSKLIPHVASSRRRYEGDIESNNDLHEVDSPIEKRSQAHANQAMKPELGDVTPHPPLRRFASSEKVFPVSPPLLPSHRSAPSTPPTAAASVPSVSAASETTAIVAVAASALVPAVPAPCVGTSPAHCVLVPFREESLSPVPHAVRRATGSAARPRLTHNRALSRPISST